MNKIVVVIVGAIVVLVAAVVAGAVLLNHLHYSSQPNVRYDALYFLNSTPFGYNYLIVLDETTYSQIVQVTHNNINVMYISTGGSSSSSYSNIYSENALYLEQIIPRGNYVILVVGTPNLVASNVGSPYNIYIPTNNSFYTIQLTYEGNWVGPLP